MRWKKSIATFWLILLGWAIATSYLSTPTYIFYAGVATSIIVDIVRELIETN